MNGLPDFESVVKLYEPLIKKFLAKYHLVYDFEEYQQIAWIALWDAYRHYDPEKGPFPAFASVTVRGCLLTEIKKRKKYSDFHESTDQIPDVGPWEGQVNDNQLEADFNLSCLSPREREWLKAAVLEGQSTKEIAAHYQVTQDTVRSWKKSAIKKLKQQWIQVKFPH